MAAAKLASLDAVPAPVLHAPSADAAPATSTIAIKIPPLSSCPWSSRYHCAAAFQRRLKQRLQPGLREDRVATHEVAEGAPLKTAVRFGQLGRIAHVRRAARTFSK